jgi:hypothetical protein
MQTTKFTMLIQPKLKPWNALAASITVGVVLLGSGIGGLIHTNRLGSQIATAQTIISSDVWRQIYQQLPDLPRENKYISKETNKVAENNTLVSRLIRYHLYVKGRPTYRLDWKLTIADYLGANEIMYDNNYPGSDTLKQNPMEGDIAAIRHLNRRQRDALVDALTNAFSKSSNVPG